MKISNGVKSKSRPFNIVIYPPKDIIAKAIKVSRQLKNKGGLFILDNKKFFPHITIYMMELPLKNVAKIRKSLRTLNKRLQPFEMTPLKYRQNKDGYVDVDFRRSQQIIKFQQKIIKTLNSFRQNLARQRFLDEFLTYKKSEQKNIKLYGYRSVGKDFFPHLTFTALKNPQTKVISKMKKFDFSFTVNRLGLFELGDHGTCRKKVEIYNLIK